MKLLVLGFDGVDFRLFDEMFPAAFPKWKWKCRSTCASDFTPTAWTTFATGVQPDDHGVGQKPPRPGYMWSRRDIDYPTIFDAIKGSDYTIGVGHIPVVSYPCSRVQGWVMSGDFVWPYAQWPEEICGPFKEPVRYNWMDLVKHTNDPTEAQVAENEQALRELIIGNMRFINGRFRSAMSGMVPDFAFLYWHGTDLAGHHLYYDREAMYEVYALAIAITNEYINQYQPDNVFVVSDHGMGPADKICQVNREYNGREYWMWGRDDGNFLISGAHRPYGVFFGDGESLNPREGDVDLSDFFGIYKEMLGA